MNERLNNFNRKVPILFSLMHDSEFVQFEGDYSVLLGHKSAAPDFKSYDANGFRHFCQYLVKNGKKTPKAESVITSEVLQKYAKQIKQATLEEFCNFLDCTAMKFRDRRKHKIENVVPGPCVLTSINGQRWPV